MLGLACVSICTVCILASLYVLLCYSEEVDVTRGIAAIETALDMMNKNMYTEAIEMIKPRCGYCVCVCVCVCMHRNILTHLHTKI